MKQMLSYRTVSLVQTGICSGIHRVSHISHWLQCVDDVGSIVTVHTYPNQKSWITGNILTELKARAAAFKEWALMLDECGKA